MRQSISVRLCTLLATIVSHFPKKQKVKTSLLTRRKAAAYAELALRKPLLLLSSVQIRHEFFHSVAQTTLAHWGIGKGAEL